MNEWVQVGRNKAYCSESFRDLCNKRQFHFVMASSRNSCSNPRAVIEPRGLHISLSSNFVRSNFHLLKKVWRPKPMEDDWEVPMRGSLENSSINKLILGSKLIEGNDNVLKRFLDLIEGPERPGGCEEKAYIDEERVRLFLSYGRELSENLEEIVAILDREEEVMAPAIAPHRGQMNMPLEDEGLDIPSLDIIPMNQENYQINFLMFLW
ncbi:hypothetical protein AMTR_s00203p00034090 [Amborella trichopoda]|uniref:Uncharacterized protein n=1 Tax=Amborella trichopoda TaxID=13333 RepID=W1P722_AMBTC|nr:hypothetical protein AMTR_s00203p00034090 [Amborella trichopoda]